MPPGELAEQPRQQLRWYAHEVEHNGRLVEPELRETVYVDLHSGSVRSTCRVRAMNDQGVPGPWLPSAEKAGLTA